MSKAVKKQEYDLADIEATIENKIFNFIYKYSQNPKYLKLPLWISECMKREIGKIVSYNIDYDTGLLQYRNLIICETISITKLEEIEVFQMSNKTNIEKAKE